MYNISVTNLMQLLLQYLATNTQQQSQDKNYFEVSQVIVSRYDQHPRVVFSTSSLVCLFFL